MLVCSGLVIILPSTLGSSGVNVESGLADAQETVGEIRNLQDSETNSMRPDENAKKENDIFDLQLLGISRIAMIGGNDPVSHIITPSNNSYVNSLNTISGNVSYNKLTHTITKVEISIKRINDSKYWDGSGWKITQNWLSTSFFNQSWSYSSSSVTWTSGNKYLIQSKVTSNKTIETPSYGNEFTFDTIKPISNINSPINNSVLKTLNSISGTASDISGSGVMSVQIFIQNTNNNLYWKGSSWSAGKSWRSVTGTTSWSYTNLPGTWTNGTKYLIQSRARDNANNIEIPSWGVVFHISSQPSNVTSTISVPINNSYVRLLYAISGTSTPGFNTIPTQVEISINRYLTSQYWNGTGWNTTENWLLASGTSSWTYNSTAVVWSSGVKYLIRSKATDNKSNVENPSFGTIFTFDNTEPTSNINFPANNSFLKNITNITGNASDIGGAGIDYVLISIKKNSTGKYYNGWNWTTNQGWFIVTGKTNWIYYIISNITWAPDKYIIYSKAVDNANNIETPSFGTVFYIKPGPNNLGSYINNPGNNSWKKSMNSITGTAFANGGLSINKVEITLYHNNLNKYWTGTGWTSTQTWLLATGKASWSYNTGSISWTNTNKYHIRSRVTHNATLVENPKFGKIFYFDNIKPSSTITYPANNTVIMKSSNGIYYINGTASDAGGSGVSYVSISIKQNSSGKYFNGWDWVTAKTWKTTSGTTSWSYKIQTNLTWQQVGKYHVQSLAVDRANNVETTSYGNNFEIKKSSSSSSSMSSSISSPSNNSYLNSVNSISGTASISSRAILKQVEISIKEVDADYYWHGTTWESGEHWLLVTGTTLWTYDSSAVLWSTDSYYQLRSRAIDDADNVEAPGAGISYMFDNEPPSSLELTINDDTEYTKSRAVTFAIEAEDSGSGIDEMAFSTDGTSWSAWEAFDTIRSFELSSGDGEKTVYLSGRDKAGNIGSDSDTINLDTFAPAISWISYNDVNYMNENIYTNIRLIELGIELKEASSKIVKIAFSDDGIDWSAWEEIDITITRSEGYLLIKDYILPSGDGVKTVFCKVQDSAGNIETYIFDNIILDTTSPEELSVQINNDAEYTNSADVILDLSANDMLSGLDGMSFSYDEITWTDWEPFNTKKSMILPSGDGEKTIYFRVKDKAGNYQHTTDAITFDTSPPHSLLIVINNGNAITNSKSVVLSIIAKDDTSGLHQMSFSDDGVLWSAWEDFAFTRSYELPAGDGEKTVYFKVTDKTGNAAEPVEATIQLETSEPILDTDNDGIPDTVDAFPSDPAASVDTDSDGYPDDWNLGKTKEHSTTGLHRDAFPDDPAASIDTDEDGYPDFWNPGMSEDDSKTNLHLDAYPNNPDKHLKSSTPTEETDWSLLTIVLVIISIIVCVLIFSFVVRNRQQRLQHSKSQFTDDKILNEIKTEILHGKLTNDSILSDAEINAKLDEKYRRGEISDNAYYNIKENR
jgi:hypothetical protein